MGNKKEKIVTKLPDDNDFIADTIYQLSGDDINLAIRKAKQQLLRDLIFDLEGSYPEYHLETVQQWLDISENGI